MKSGQEIVSSTSKNKDIKTPNSSPNSVFQRLFRKLSPRRSPERCSNSALAELDTVASGDDDKVMERVFNYFDENGDGKISAAELQSCMRTAGVGELSREEAEMAVQSSDSDEDGLLDLKDFNKLIKGSGLSEEERKEELREAFGMFAAEGTGCITAKSLKRMLSRLGESPSVSNCEAMIRKFDLNGDGVLNFDEFNNMMKH